MATMKERFIEFAQNRANAARYAVFMNRDYLFRQHGIMAMPRLFTAVNQRLVEHIPEPRPAINVWMSGNLYKWAKRKTSTAGGAS